MGDFHELPPLAAPRTVAELTPEGQRFQAFAKKWEKKEVARVVRVAYSPTEPYRLAVASGTRVGLWHAGLHGEATNDMSFSKFKDLVQCASWRSDGKLLMLGDNAGNCTVYETDTKKSLRRFRGHGDAVSCASFASADRSRAATGGRDGRLRTWDVVTGDLVQTIDAHGDCMKVLASGPGGPDAWITAGYDGKVRLWDLRASENPCSVTADHGQSVEDGVAFPGGATFVTAGGPVVKTWDFAKAGKPMQVIEAHSKATTGICLNGDASVMLTCSFDGTTKVWETAEFRSIWTYRLAGPATSVSWRPDDRAFAVGLDDGSWLTHVWVPSEAEKQKEQAEQRPKKTEAWSLYYEHVADDEVVDVPKRRRRGELKSDADFFLKKFEYKKLLDHVIKPDVEPLVGFTVIDEMISRGELWKMLADLGPEKALEALDWFQRVFSKGDSLQHQIFEEALHTLMDTNSCLNPPSTPELTLAVEKLTNKIDHELKTQQILMETSGMFKSIMLA